MGAARAGAHARSGGMAGLTLVDITQSYAPTGGGVRTYLHAKRAAWLAHGRGRHVLVVPGPRSALEEGPGWRVRWIRSPRVPGSNVYRLLWRADEVYRTLREERPDIVEVHCPYVLPWTAFAYRRGHPDVPVVGAYHTDLPTAYLEPAVRRWLGPWAGLAARWLGDRYVRALYGRCDATLVFSPQLHARLRGLGVPRLQLVPLGVDLATFHPGRRDAAWRRRWGAADDELVLVYAGRFDSERRVRVLVDAFAQLPAERRMHLVLVGDGPLRPELEAQAQRLTRLHVLPFQPDRAGLAAVLASADVYVSAMPYETFGLAVVEAQACGLPVVGVRSGAMVDRVVDGSGLLARPDDPKDLARCLLAPTMAQWRAMGERARRVAERFSWERTFDAVFTLYDDLRAERRHARAP